jgi:hypothetical protein
MMRVGEQAKFIVFDSHEEWLRAREDNIGASTLAQFAITGEHAKPLPTGIPALDSALRFGSDWEPFIAQLVARHLTLSIAPKNTPFERLEDGQMSWHDDSFYTMLDGKVHASLDVAAIIGGIQTIIEIKTSSATRFEFVSNELRQRYLMQADIEAFISGAKQYIIAFAHRPTDWETMTTDDISTALADSLETLRYDSHMDEAQLKKLYDDYEKSTKPEVEYSVLLDNILDWEAKAKEGRKQLQEMLARTPGMIVGAQGKIAQLKESKRVLTDWKKLVEDYHVEDLTPYRTEKTSQSLSITKAK